ncbi:MAG: hypothetical protein QMD09_08260, partial [Desulfatibacillaceae bacterium]|nr:hypothetical protein [Desulfatibacillaceae bacterium]
EIISALALRQASSQKRLKGERVYRQPWLVNYPGSATFMAKQADDFFPVFFHGLTKRSRPCENIERAFGKLLFPRSFYDCQKRDYSKGKRAWF